MPGRRPRGTGAGQRYDHRHRALRAQWEPKVKAGNVTCWRCGWPILPGQAWDLGHDDDGITVRGPEHRHRTRYCIGNRTAATIKGNQMRQARPSTRGFTDPRW